MDETKYLLDAVSVSKMTRELVTSDYIQQNCFLPEEILYEIRDNRNYEVLVNRKYQTDIRLLEFVKFVLSKIEPGHKIIDLYNNNGNGDIILLAAALAETDTEVDKLIKTHWKIITDDGDLTQLAKKFGIATLKTENFVKIANSTAQARLSSPSR